jgi:hypothetical protein
LIQNFNAKTDAGKAQFTQQQDAMQKLITAVNSISNLALVENTLEGQVRCLFPFFF